VQEFEGACCSGDFVTEVVGPATIGVEIVEMLMEFLGQKLGDDAEIFVVVRGEPAGVLLRGFGRTAGWGRVSGDFEFVGVEHGYLVRRKKAIRRAINLPSTLR
jgi:hypothetical protein